MKCKPFTWNYLGLSNLTENTSNNIIYFFFNINILKQSRNVSHIVNQNSIGIKEWRFLQKIHVKEKKYKVSEGMRIFNTWKLYWKNKYGGEILRRMYERTKWCNLDWKIASFQNGCVMETCKKYWNWNSGLLLQAFCRFSSNPFRSCIGSGKSLGRWNSEGKARRVEGGLRNFMIKVGNNFPGVSAAIIIVPLLTQTNS